MEVVRKINDELAIAGIVTVQQFYQIAEEGFRSVLNLRSLDRGSLAEEKRSVERLGLCYVNLPIDTEVMSPEVAGKVLKQIGKLPKPSLVCCNNAMLAAAVVLMYIAIGQGEPLQKAFKRAEDLGLFASLQAAAF
ncbi:beta-lactamase hydrolase domain-containing protein [Leptolyngbya ohadii]|uniref:beta-lactamase hydrolase domain-containing protein n=1 Tax=Leptolyngbya ohadii TaxID=1962290 RepID=UPI000B5A1AA5|nr:sulfur transferase domain-containing protein [Leptolyngbya ohadii]